MLNSLRSLANGPKSIFGKSGPIYWILLIITIPILPVFLITRESVLTHASKSFIVALDDLTDAKYHVAQFIQSDLGLESHIQITVTAILLLLANSETRTIVGLEVLFKNETLFYLPARVALGFSIAWSVYSCISSHLKGIAKKREHSTTKSLVSLLSFTSSSITLRVMTYILYFTPCLGLMDCLRHLQGEMYPHYEPYFSFVNVSEDTFYFGDAPPRPWSDITRWNYIGEQDAEPPVLTLYTLFTIEQYFWSFFGILIINIVSQLVAKKFTNPSVFKSTSWIDLLIHSITCTFIPHPIQEWDEGTGNIKEHKQRQKKVWNEMLGSIIVNFGVNVILLSPLIILGKF